MIVINRDRKFERIESWDDVIGLPGYVETIDPKQTKPEEIFGWYTLDHVKCGLQGCRTPHNRGYVVRTVAGTVTNIGHQCGRETFGVDFEEMARNFDRAWQEQDHRERLSTFASQVPTLRERVASLRTIPRGATWCYRWVTHFTEKKSPERVPELVRRHLADMLKRGTSTLVIERVATKAEADMREAQSGRKSSGPITIEERVAEIAGMDALQEANDLRRLLVEGVDNVLADFSAVDVDTMPAKDLRGWVKRVEDVAQSIAAADAAVVMARRFLQPENLRPLERLFPSVFDNPQLSAGRGAFVEFLDDLQRSLELETGAK